MDWPPGEIFIPLSGVMDYAEPLETDWKMPYEGTMTKARLALTVRATGDIPNIAQDSQEFPSDASCIKDAFLLFFGQGEVELVRVSDLAYSQRM